MIDSTTIEGYCADCGTSLPSPPGAPIEQRKPCPQCGSLARRYDVKSYATVSLHGSVKGVGRDERGWRWLEFFSGDDLWRKFNRWMDKYRLIDRRTNRYRERVVDKTTGAVVRDVDESLTAHIGHGSAKQPRAKG